MDIGGVVYLLVELVIVGLIFWLAWWFLGYCGIPEPFNKVIRVIIGLVALVFLIYILMEFLGAVGGAVPFHPLRR